MTWGIVILNQFVTPSTAEVHVQCPPLHPTLPSVRALAFPVPFIKHIPDGETIEPKAKFLTTYCPVLWSYKVGLVG